MTDKAFYENLTSTFRVVYPEGDYALAFDCPPGWEQILWEFSRDLEAFVKKTGANVTIGGCKEKYAQLLIYLRGDDRNRPPDPTECPHCKAKLHLRCKFCPDCGGKIRTRDDTKGATVQRMVEAARERSEVTCQECGRPGSWQEVRHWEYVLCPEHYTLRNFGHGNLFHQAVNLLREVPRDTDEHAVMAAWREEVEAFLVQVEDHDRRWVPDHGLVEE